ncbi:MAG: cell fate (sporulation/competence/biofilm development) regulator YlbF (YheA/YmcA/DUF963 family) [Verrucomicrobiales bacterium]|jgi:cell fate (sporulation/competence/biofilm development) regulator YlbF (YheA/YmcA/DUF963 family)
MNTTAEAVTIEESLHSLCAAIVSDKETSAARAQAEAFLEDEQGVALYKELMNLGRSLHQLEANGEQPSPQDVARFEELRTQADGHDGINKFNAAQDHLQSIANMVNGYVTKTLQNGAIPTEEEMLAAEGGCCGGSGGGGCGC